MVGQITALLLIVHPPAVSTDDQFGASTVWEAMLVATPPETPTYYVVDMSVVEYPHLWE